MILALIVVYINTHRGTFQGKKVVTGRGSEKFYGFQGSLHIEVGGAGRRGFPLGEEGSQKVVDE